MDQTRPRAYYRIDGYETVFRLDDGVDMYFLHLATTEWVQDQFFMNIFWDTSMGYHEIPEEEAKALETEIRSAAASRSRWWPWR